MKKISLAACALCAASVLGASWKAVSPDGLNVITLTTEPVLSYSVARRGQARVAPTPIALEVAGRGTLGGARLQGAQVEERATSGTLATPRYKKARVDLAGRFTKVAFAAGWGVELAARNDGVAYRFFTDWDDAAVEVTSERADIAFPSGELDAWAGLTGGLCSSWESIYTKCKVRALEGKNQFVYLPLLVGYPDGGVMCVTESDLLDYPGWNLRAKGPALLASASACLPDPAGITDDGRHRRVSKRLGYLAKTAGRRTYPWRTFILADAPTRLAEADIVTALASPSRLSGDLSWIKPGKVAWDWWNFWNVRGVDFRAGCNTATYKYYIDFAAANGLEYVIMDEGWSVALRIMEINPETDVPEIVRYGREKGVGIVLWCGWPQLVGRQHEVFKHYAALGVKGFKIDFMDRDDQFVVKYLEETARIAAEYRLVLDYHGMYKPTGLSRTYPNVLNYEGVHGLETAKFCSDYDTPGSDVKVLFTRMTAGPMDYTPGGMRHRVRPQDWNGNFAPNKKFEPNWNQPDVQGTRVHQMALMSLCEAPFQMLCDSPTQYAANQECFDFMRAVPVTWDEVRGLGGDPDHYFALARRKGEVWYVGAVNTWEAQEITLDLSFLGSDAFVCESFEDGLNADRDPADYVKRVAKRSFAAPFTVKLAPGGGWTARIAPARGLRDLFK